MAESWADSPIVFVEAIVCPACGTPRPILVRSDKGGDGSTSRKCICRACSQRFVAVIELPDFGKRKMRGSKIQA